jgi:hypothetical protein
VASLRKTTETQTRVSYCFRRFSTRTGGTALRRKAASIFRVNCPRSATYLLHDVFDLTLVFHDSSSASDEKIVKRVLVGDTALFEVLMRG